MAIGENPEPVDAERLSHYLSSRTETPALQTATTLTPGQISQAARELARLPRRPKRKWTGWLNENWHGYRDQKVVLPSGRVWYLYGALRGKAVVTSECGTLPGGWGDGPFGWGVLPASQIRRYRNPAAQILGKSKLGRKERPSPLKAEAARRNGTLPCREGRRRGRPALRQVGS